MPRRKGAQKIQAAPGQGYGQAKQQEDAQRAVPLPDRFNQTVESAAAMKPPAGGLLAPSARPNEPITAGLGARPQPARNPGVNPDAASLAKQLPLLEAIASQPGATVSMRNLVRRLRSQIPPEGV